MADRAARGLLGARHRRARAAGGGAVLDVERGVPDERRRRARGRRAPRRTRRARAGAPRRGRRRRRRRSRASRPARRGAARARARADRPSSDGEMRKISGSCSSSADSSSSSSRTSITVSSSPWPSSPSGLTAIASASTGSPAASQRTGRVVESRMPAIGRSTASAFAPWSCAARAEAASLTRTMIAIPSPSEILWLRRRVPGTWSRKST